MHDVQGYSGPGVVAEPVSKHVVWQYPGLPHVAPGHERPRRLAQVVGNGYEGLVAKDEASVYEGGPTRCWLKVKQKASTGAEDRWRRRISVAPAGDRAVSLT